MGLMNKVMNFLGLQDENDHVDQRDALQEDELEPVVTETRKHKGNVVSIHSQKNVKLVLSEPRSYEETQDIADQLRSRRPVIVNLQRVRKDQAVRIIDFLSGTVYALNGNIAKIGANIFVCTPESVEIQGTITEMLQDEAMN